MAMSRRDFTALAEWVGEEQAIADPEATDIIDSLADTLSAHTDTFGGSFKREVFTRHAVRERDSIAHNIDPRTGQGR